MALEVPLDIGNVAKQATSSSTAPTPLHPYKIIIIIIGTEVPEIIAEEDIEDETLTPTSVRTTISSDVATTNNRTTNNRQTIMTNN